MRAVLLGVALLLVACGDGDSSNPFASETDVSPADLIGSWGGQGIELNLTETGGNITYDCAGGSLTEPLDLASDNSFTAVGTHTIYRGGPSQEGDPAPPQFDATYWGNTNGEEMNFYLVVGDGETKFELSKGRIAVLNLCG